MILPSLLQYSDWGLVFLRVAVAAIFLYHAWPKLKNPGPMAQAMGISAMMPRMLGFVETVGALFVLTGLYFQVGAILLSIVMIGALKMKMRKWHVPFMASDKTGWEFDFLILAANITFLLGGPGGISL